jgi:hypothetical protein
MANGIESGNLYGRVADNQGEPLPGVTITLTGVEAPQIQVTNAEGEFRFLGLAPGKYEVIAELEGFSTVQKPVEIFLGRDTNIEITMSVAIIE